MLIERILEIVSIIVSIGLLLYFVPLSKLREAILSLLFMQSLTWILGGIMVELKLISYPVRFFSYAFRTSFTFEFIVFPIVSVLFNLYFPKNGTWIKKLFYSICFPTMIIIGETIIEHYTNNIKYIHWNWFYSWSSMWVTLLIAYSHFRWYFKKYRTDPSKRGNFYPHS